MDKELYHLLTSRDLECHRLGLQYLNTVSRDRIIELICSPDPEVKEIGITYLSNLAVIREDDIPNFIMSKILNVMNYLDNIKKVSHITAKYQICWILEIFKEIDSINNYYETNH